MADPYDKPGLLPDDNRQHREDTHPEEAPANERAADDLNDQENLYNPGRDAISTERLGKEQLANAESEPADTLGGGYNPDDNPRSQRLRKWVGKNKRKAATGGGIAAALLALVVGAFSALQPFKLANFMENVDATAFIRYQVDMRGRSSKWVNAYMVLRLGEIDDKTKAPKDRDNILFRADRVDNNKPLTDWYRTLRASQFEQDLFEKHGIKFTSVAKKEGNLIKFRPGIVTVNEKTIEAGFKTSRLQPGSSISVADLDSLTTKADINSLNGRLRDFIEVKEFNNDKEARAALKAITKERYSHWWNAAKRYHVRHDIQNMIGVRNWRFFEETRNKAYDKRVAVRNKIIINMLPDDTKSGKFVQCLFGITDCKASEDPISPDNRALTPGATKDGENKTDADGNPIDDGSGTDVISKGASGEGSKIITKELLSKLNLATSVASILESFSRFDASLHNHSLTKLVSQAKKAQAAGLFTTFAVASDQLKTGKVTSSEVGAFMSAFGNPTNNAAWSDVVDPVSSSSKAFAAAKSSEFTEAKTATAFCSKEHQAEIDKPENYEAADKEFQYLCPQYLVGDTNNNAAKLESGWDNGPGKILHPILAAYHKATGGVLGIFNTVVGAVVDPIVSGTLKVLGLDDDIKSIVAWVAEKALAFFGGGPMIDENTPSGQVANVVMEGGAVVSEASMRQQGAAKTTSQTAALASKNYLAYQEQKSKEASFGERYFATSNPRSLLSRQLFAFSNLSLGSLFSNAFKVFGSAANSPSRLLTDKAHAELNSPYAAANFSAITTFDFPSQCLDGDPLEMTPQSATNADDLGYIPADELNWDMMTNKETWADELYRGVDNDEQKAMQVWNCALLDNTVRGALGSLYGYKGEDALSN
jgi:hypothetical protein